MVTKEAQRSGIYWERCQKGNPPKKQGVGHQWGSDAKRSIFMQRAQAVVSSAVSERWTERGQICSLGLRERHLDGEEEGPDLRSLWQQHLGPHEEQPIKRVGRPVPAWGQVFCQASAHCGLPSPESSSKFCFLWNWLQHLKAQYYILQKKL